MSKKKTVDGWRRYQLSVVGSCGCECACGCGGLVEWALSVAGWIEQGNSSRVLEPDRPIILKSANPENPDSDNKSNAVPPAGCKRQMLPWPTIYPSPSLPLSKSPSLPLSKPPSPQISCKTRILSHFIPEATIRWNPAHL